MSGLSECHSPYPHTKEVILSYWPDGLPDEELVQEIILAVSMENCTTADIESIVGEFYADQQER